MNIVDAHTWDWVSAHAIGKTFQVLLATGTHRLPLPQSLGKASVAATNTHVGRMLSNYIDRRVFDRPDIQALGKHWCASSVEELMHAISALHFSPECRVKKTGCCSRTRRAKLCALGRGLVTVNVVK
jgi:hypothetical protein